MNKLLTKLATWWLGTQYVTLDFINASTSPPIVSSSIALRGRHLIVDWKEQKVYEGKLPTFKQ